MDHINSEIPSSGKTIQPGYLLYIGKYETNKDTIEYRTYKILSIDNSGQTPQFHLSHYKTGEYKVISQKNLYSQDAEPGELIVFAPNIDSIIKQLKNFEDAPASLPASSIPENYLKKADEIFRKVEMVDQLVSEYEKRYKTLGIHKGRAELISEACEAINKSNKFQTGIHRSSYYAYKKRITRSYGDIFNFASRSHRSSFNQTKIDRTTTTFVDTCLLTYYADEEYRLNPQTIFTKVMPEILERTSNKWIDPEKCGGTIPNDLTEELLNFKIPIEKIMLNPEKRSLLSEVKLPGRSWLYNYYRWFKANPNQTEVNIRKRYGDDFFEKSIMVFDTYAWQAKFPLQYVVADHCYIDIYIVDDETRSETFRIWLTILIDAFSRCVLGIALLDEYPCIESIQNALKHAIWPKNEWLEELGIELELPWKCYGIPLTLSLDNAWAHHSISLESLCRRISFNGEFDSIELAFRPPYKGRYGALVERFLGNIQEQIKELLKGAIRGRTYKHTKNARKDASLLFSDLQKAVVEIISKYHYTKHSELWMTPMEKWNEGMQAREPYVPKLTEDVKRFFLRSSTDTRVVRPDGIHVFNLTYWSPALKKAQKVGWDKKNVKYGFSYDVNNINTLSLFMDDKWICDVKANELRIGYDEWLDLSLAELNIAKRISKERYGATTNFMQFLHEVKELGEQRTKEKKKAARKKSNTFKQGVQTKQSTHIDNRKQSPDELTNLVADIMD